MDDVTPKRKTFSVSVVIRPGETPVEGSMSCEKIREGNIRATGPISARRGVMESTWSQGWLVSRFLSIECLD